MRPFLNPFFGFHTVSLSLYIALSSPPCRYIISFVLNITSAQQILTHISPLYSVTFIERDLQERKARKYPFPPSFFLFFIIQIPPPHAAKINLIPHSHRHEWAQRQYRPRQVLGGHSPGGGGSTNAIIITITTIKKEKEGSRAPRADRSRGRARGEADV